MPVVRRHAELLDTAPAVGHHLPFLLVVEQNEENRWWLVYLEYPEVGIEHTFRYILIRTLQVNLNALRVVEVVPGETSVLDDMDEDDDSSVFRWRAGFFADSDSD